MRICKWISSRKFSLGLCLRALRMEVCLYPGRYQNCGVIVPHFIAYKQWTQCCHQNELFSQQNCINITWAGLGLHPRVVFRILQEEKKKYLEDDLRLLLSVMENKDPVVATLKHAFNLKYMSSPYLPQWVWIRAIIITNHESLLSAALFFQGHLCGCLYKNTVKN